MSEIQRDASRPNRDSVVGYFEIFGLEPARGVCHAGIMPKRIRKRRQPEPDINQLVHRSIQKMADAAETPKPALVRSEISRVMAEMGRRGGKIGGKRRAERMTEAQRSNAAALAANARWAKLRSAN